VSLSFLISLIHSNIYIVTKVCVPGTILLTFDTLTACASGSLVPNGYGCLNWDEVGFLDGHTQSVGSGYYTSVISGDYNTFNYNGVPMSITPTTAGATFAIDSFYATASTVNNLAVTVTGSYSGSTLYTTSLTLNTTTPQLITLNWSGVDTVLFTPSSTNWFALDNMIVTM
jgi:hypothetical protein